MKEEINPYIKVGGKLVNTGTITIHEIEPSGTECSEYYEPHQEDTCPHGAKDKECPVSGCAYQEDMNKQLENRELSSKPLFISNQEDMKTTPEWEKEFDTFWDISKDILVDRADGTLNAVKKELNAFIKQAILTARKEALKEVFTLCTQNSMAGFEGKIGKCELEQLAFYHGISLTEPGEELGK